MSPWLITTTGWSWIVGAAIHDSAGVFGRPTAMVAALAVIGVALFLGVHLRRRSTS
ncbi:MAG TPA: hypothetical protein VGG09_05655 [Acidimicrobiales bacterium]